MNFKNIMIIKAIAAFIIGCSMLLIPHGLFLEFGIDLSNGGILAARLYGASAIGILCLSWFGRDLQDKAAIKVISVDMFIYNFIGFIITLLAVLSGIVNFLGWIIVFVFLFFTITFGYLLLYSQK